MNRYIKILLVSMIMFQVKALLCSQYMKPYLCDFVINNPYNDESDYLAKLLHVNRNGLEKKFNKTLAEYLRCKKELQNNKAHFPFSANIAKSEAKIRELSIELNTLLNQNISSHKTNLKRALLSCEQVYLTALKKEEDLDYDINIAHKDAILKKMSLLAQALYLVASNEEDLAKNNGFFKKKISLKFHPDKTINDQEIKFFKDTSPLLQNNERNEHITAIFDKLNKANDSMMEELNNPSFAKQIGFMAADITLPYIAQGFGQALGHMTFGQVIPNSPGKDKASNMCVHKARETALKIESVLINHVYKL